jgi:hypothetical protein
VVSSRAIEAWKRFAAWYGADTLERKYGLKPPEDWCEIFDSLDRDQLARVLADVRVKFPTWMPGLGEFEQLVREIRKPVPMRGPTVQEQLTSYVLRNYRLTFNQTRGPWRWLGTGNQWTGEGFAITGVVIPADGDAPGYRVMVVDMQSEAA